MSEEWLPIPGFTGYEVSDLGSVRCWRAWGFRKPPTEPRVLKQKTGTNGYLNVILGFKGPTKQVHRLVAELFVSGQTPLLEVAHDNGDKHDNRAENLIWKTRKQNTADKRRHGTHGRSLTEQTVSQIRSAYVPGKVTQKEVADQFGITQAAVSKIIRGQRWGNAA